MSVNQVNQTTGALSPIAGGTLYADAPVGSIQAYGGTTAPWGWLLCQGQAISRTTYAELFGVIGTSFGAGDGSTSFNVPDLRETAPVGSGTRGGGVTTHDTYTVGQFKDDQFQAHYHLIGPEGTGQTYGPVLENSATSGASFAGLTSLGTDKIAAQSNNISGQSGTTTHGKQLGVNYIIKATTIALPSDFEAAVDEKIKEVTTPNLTALTAVTKNIANGQTYLNQNIFTIPADARRVFFSMAGSGNIGGYVELIKGIQGYARDFNNISEALVSWTNNNVVNISYIFNHTGAAKDITFQCQYLA